MPYCGKHSMHYGEIGLPKVCVYCDNINLREDNQLLRDALEIIAVYKKGVSPVTTAGLRGIAQQALKERESDGRRMEIISKR